MKWTEDYRNNAYNNQHACIQEFVSLLKNEYPNLLYGEASEHDDMTYKYDFWIQLSEKYATKYYDLKEKTKENFSFTYINGNNEHYFDKSISNYLVFADKHIFYIVDINNFKKWISENKPVTHESLHTKNSRYFWISIDDLDKLSEKQLERPMLTV